MAIRLQDASPLVLTGACGKCEDDCACPESPLVLNFSEPLPVENDCACPTQPASARIWSLQEALYAQIPDAYTEQLTDEFWLAFSPYAPAGPSILNKTAWERWQSFFVPQPLTQTVDHILAQQTLLQPAGNTLQVRPGHLETLTAWLHVTNACNLDCPYCYVSKTSASMDKVTGLNAVERIFQTAQDHQFHSVKLKYAGGEATLHFDLVRKLGEHAKGLSEQTGIGLDQIVLSNGTRLHLSDADWLAEKHVKIMISLDGRGEMHDQMRPMKSGRSAFQAIEHTIDNVLLPRGILPAVTITVTGKNATGIADAVRWALERDLPVSLNFYRHTSLAQRPQELELEENAIIQGILEAYAVFEEIMPTRPFLNGLLDRVQAGAHLHACGVGLAYVVITHAGKIAQCQMHPERAISASPQDDLLSLIAAGPIRSISVDQKAGCQGCLYRYRCAGGCPLETFRATGRWDAKNPNCNIYKALLPAALRLEGLRILKYHGYLQ
ncbi:MAG: radical SAM protein [Anaerolineales bacterium]|nr:radical SAM protein [Anaerolineales bacterium]